MTMRSAEHFKGSTDKRRTLLETSDFEEQKQMIESKIADIKNMGRDYCGTITAGLFIQAFAQGRPWIHLDIAGTAWTDNPLYQGQPQGATAAGTSSLYYLLAGGEETCF